MAHFWFKVHLSWAPSPFALSVVLSAVRSVQRPAGALRPAPKGARGRFSGFSVPSVLVCLVNYSCGYHGARVCITRRVSALLISGLLAVLQR